MPDYAIAIDLGGTNLRVAAVLPSGDLLEKISVPTNISLGREHLMEAITTGIQKVRRLHARDKLRGIGIGVPGFILLDKGIITKSPNLPGLENFPMRDDLEQRVGCPVVLENDANAAALGEKWKGAGRAVDDLVLLTLGTGIGGGIISGGKVLHGYLGMAGELGHITVDPASPVRCGCGNYGCLEVHASATAIVRMAREAILANRSPALAARSDSSAILTPSEIGALSPRVPQRPPRYDDAARPREAKLTSELVYDLALAGDAECRAIFERMGHALGLGLGILINTFNFPLYLLSGGVLAAWGLFAPAMLDEARKRSLTLRETTTRIERAELGDLAGLYGAACLALHAPPRAASRAGKTTSPRKPPRKASRPRRKRPPKR